MTIFVDASALVAIIKDEPEAPMLIDAIEEHSVRLISGPAMWESMRAVAKTSGGSIEEAWRLCERYRIRFEIALAPINADETAEAVRAHARYGNGTGHPARLNMGDCFAYACARTNDARLLYKGHDFTHTDLA